jgi:hypothetical protein
VGGTRFLSQDPGAGLLTEGWLGFGTRASRQDLRRGQHIVVF